MEGDLVVYLKDGRRIDLSDLSPADVVAELKLRGITPEDVEATVHCVQRATEPFRYVGPKR